MSSRSRFSKNLVEKAARLFMWLAAVLVVGVLGWILVDIVCRAASELSLSFLVEDPTAAGLDGGIGPIMLSTLLILLVALTVAVPLSLASAIALSEQGRQRTRLAWMVRRSLDVLAAVPSIVFGLFGNAFFCITLGLGYSILAGGLTLACMILPILIRTTEQGIRAVPSEHFLAAASLGISRTTTLFRVILPVAMPAVAAGLVLGIGRAIAETAALIFTSGYVSRRPESLLDSGRSMSVHIYDMAMNVPGGDARAYATAAVLVLVLFVINATAIRLTRLASQQAHPSIAANHSVETKNSVGAIDS